MTAGLLYKCRWQNNKYPHSHGWDMLLFIGIETINREDGVVIHNYRFHDLIENKTFLMDEGLALRCKEIKGDSHECD
tara:strand:- start:238 stop:468 length:231 start_codon:yes stop_codon:yes gene_type:complete